MRNIATIAKYELLRLIRDKRLMIMVLSQPIVVALISGLLAFHAPTHVKVQVFDEQAGTYSKQFIDELDKNDEIEVQRTDDFGNEAIQKGEARAVVKLNFNQTVDYKGKIEVKTDPSGSLASIVASQKIAEAAQKVAKTMAEDNIKSHLEAKQQYLQSQLTNIPAGLLTFEINEQSYDPIQLATSDGTSEKIKYFDYYGSSMMVVLVLLVVLNLSGISITSERVSGTFERITVTPYRKVDIIGGKAIALFLIGLVVNVLGIISLKLIYGINLGNIYLLFTTALSVVFMAVNLGLLVSSVTKNVVESVEAAMYVFFVSFLLSGILLPIETAHSAYAAAMKFFPFYHAVNVSRNINMLGAGWLEVKDDIGIVLAYGVVFMLLAMLTLRREAK